MDDSAIVNVEDMELLSRIVRNMTYVQEFDELLWKDQFCFLKTQFLLHKLFLCKRVQ